MSVSIKKRIYWSFLTLVLLFAANSVISFISIRNNRIISEYVSTVVNPSVQSLEDFKNLLIVSKVFTTNQVFLKSKQNDEIALKRLHDIDYARLKKKLKRLSAKWDDKSMSDSLNKIFNEFEQVVVIEKRIMSSLQKFEDYGEVAARQEAQNLAEEVLLPQTSLLINTLSRITLYELNIRNKKNDDLQKSFIYLKALISALTITIILLSIFLSIYLANIIINPINKIRDILNDLGNGVIRKVNQKITNDEIGEMVYSVNNLSEKLERTAAFATEIGNRNFDSYFEPLGPQDTLGKALVAMRDNLKTSDESLNEAQHIAKLGSWKIDIMDNKLFWSDELYNIFDIDPEKFDPSYESYLNCVHPADKEYVHNIMKSCVIDHKPFSYECRILTRDNSLKTIFAHGKVHKNNKNELVEITGIVQDITEAKKAKTELEAANKELSILFNSIDEVFFSVNMVTLKVIQISATCEKLYGYKQAEFVDNYMLWLDIIHPDDKYLITDEDQMLRKGEQVNNQYRIIRKDNKIRWVETKITPTLDKDGNLIRVDGITRDITKRKKAESALHKSEEQYRQIVETAQEGIWMIDANSNTTFVNKKMCDMLGYSQSEMMGKRLFDFMDEEGRKIAEAGIQKRKRGDSSVTFDFKFITKTGSPLWTFLCDSTVYDDNGNYMGALAMVTDITKRKHDEELLQKSQRTLEINNQKLEQKNKELEQFAYVASHDLQEPLKTTISFVDIFKQQYSGKLDARADKYLTYITQASDRMHVLIKDLLDFSRIGHNKDIEQVDCNLILNEVITDLNTTIKDSGTEIKAGPLPVITGYATELKQLFQNLLTNAIKFTKKNVPPRISITAEKKQDYWQFAFSDNGIGIDKQHSERIFIIFQRLHTRSEYEGTGIGLSHCKKIVELHRGKIWVESTPNEGSTFYFTIHQLKKK